MRLKTIITSILLIFYLQSNAQSFSDILNVNYNHFSKVNNDLDNNNIINNQLNIYKLYLAGPPIELGKLRIVYNTEYKWFQNDFKLINNEKPLLAQNLHDVKLTTIFNYKLNEKWALNYVNFSSIKSDFRNFNISNSYKGINAFTVGYHPKGDDNFRFGLGVTHSKEMGEALLLPVAFLYYKTDKWLIDLMYPRLNVFYKPFKKLEYGFVINYDIGAFDVEFNDALTNNMSIKPKYQAATNLTFTPQINYYLNDKINLYIRSGLKLLSEQKLMDRDFNEIENNGFKASKMESTFGIGLTIKIPNH